MQVPKISVPCKPRANTMTKCHVDSVTGRQPMRDSQTGELQLQAGQQSLERALLRKAAVDGSGVPSHTLYMRLARANKANTVHPRCECGVC